jgi:hypothetical protein
MPDFPGPFDDEGTACSVNTLKRRKRRAPFLEHRRESLNLRRRALSSQNDIRKCGLRRDVTRVHGLDRLAKLLPDGSLRARTNVKITLQPPRQTHAPAAIEENAEIEQGPHTA